MPGQFLGSDGGEETTGSIEVIIAEWLPPT